MSGGGSGEDGADMAADLAAAFARNTTLEAIEIHPDDITAYADTLTDPRIMPDPDNDMPDHSTMS